jgi:hypothetical protein
MERSYPCGNNVEYHRFYETSIGRKLEPYPVHVERVAVWPGRRGPTSTSKDSWLPEGQLVVRRYRLCNERYTVAGTCNGHIELCSTRWLELLRTASKPFYHRQGGVDKNTIKGPALGFTKVCNFIVAVDVGFGTVAKLHWAILLEVRQNVRWANQENAVVTGAVPVYRLGGVILRIQAI